MGKFGLVGETTLGRQNGNDLVSPTRAAAGPAERGGKLGDCQGLCESECKLNHTFLINENLRIFPNVNGRKTFLRNSKCHEQTSLMFFLRDKNLSVVFLKKKPI